MEEMDYQREGYGFRSFFNAGTDKVTLETDTWGVDVYIIDSNGDAHFESEVFNISIDDIKEMTDDEFNNFKIENGIF